MGKKKQTFAPGKLPTGIAGLDHLTGGGLLARRTTLVLGPSGSGKTLLSLQTLAGAAARGEAGIFVSFTSSLAELDAKGAAFGWNLPGLRQRGMLWIESPSEVKAGRIDLAGLLDSLLERAAERHAARIAFDSFDFPLGLIEDRLARAREIFRLRDWLFENQFTGIVTADPRVGQFGTEQRVSLLQFLADMTVQIDFRQFFPGGHPTRYARVVSHHAAGTDDRAYPFAIGSGGIEILSGRAKATECSGAPEAISREIKVVRKKLCRRIKAFDHFLEAKQAEMDFLLSTEPSDTVSVDPATLPQPPRGGLYAP